jgi:DNA polymerase-4
VTTVAELAGLGRPTLNELFGQWGESLHRKAQGLNTAHFDFHEEPKSISNEHTFAQDTSNPEELHATLAQLVERTAHRLREHHMFAVTITLKLRDLDFRTITRAVSLGRTHAARLRYSRKSPCASGKSWDHKA